MAKFLDGVQGRLINGFASIINGLFDASASR